MSYPAGKPEISTTQEEEYLSAIERSVVKDIEIKVLLKLALTDKS